MSRMGNQLTIITLGMILLGGTILGSTPFAFADDHDDKKEKLKAKLKELLEKVKDKIKNQKPEKPEKCKGIKYGEIWGTSDVYRVRLPLPGDSQTLVLGQVLKGMQPDDDPVEGKKNDPMMPVAWTKTYRTEDGKVGRIFTTTMGASQDFVEPGLRRLLVNAVYWTLGMQDQITPDSKIDFVTKFKPTRFGSKKPEDGYWKKVGRRPADYELPAVK